MGPRCRRNKAVQAIEHVVFVEKVLFKERSIALHVRHWETWRKEGDVEYRCRIGIATVAHMHVSGRADRDATSRADRAYVIVES